MAKRPRRPQSGKERGDQIIDAALELVLVEGWTRLKMSRIAVAAGLSLDELYRTFPSKIAILMAFLARIDTATAAAIDTDHDDETSTRDRIFEVVMARFDVLTPYKEAVRTIARDLRCDPVTSFCAAPAFRRSISWMLECAGLSSTGIRGLARTKGLGVIYLATFCVWLRDDSTDMAKTMASLDRHLARTERFIRRGCALGRRRGEYDEAEVAA